MFRQGLQLRDFSGTLWAGETENCPPADSDLLGSQEHLVNFDDLFDRRVLANDFPPEPAFTISGITAPATGIKNCAGNGLHTGCLALLTSACGFDCVVHRSDKFCHFKNLLREPLEQPSRQLQPSSQTSVLQHLDAVVASRESLTLPSEIV